MSLVSGVGLEPSAFITQTFWVAFVLPASLPFKARWDANATLAPSGDHAGSKLAVLEAVTVVNGFWPEPRFEELLNRVGLAQ